MAVAAIVVLVVESLGSLGHSVAAADNQGNDIADGEHASPDGRVVVSKPAPITTPGGAGGLTEDTSIGGPPLFLPYTPPADTVELADERTAKSRTLENPDGTFKTEISDGPINFQDAKGGPQPGPPAARPPTRTATSTPRRPRT